MKKLLYYSREASDFFLVFFIAHFSRSNGGEFFEVFLPGAYFNVFLGLVFVVSLKVAGVYKISWKFFNLYHIVILLTLNLLVLVLLEYPALQVLTAEGITDLAGLYAIISFLTLLSRVVWFFYLNPESRKKKTGDRPVLIYGAGTVTMHLLQDLRSTDLLGRYHIADIIDKNSEKIGSRVGPYRVQDASRLRSIVEKKSIKEIWLTMPVNTVNMEELFSQLVDFPVTYKVVPRKFEQIMPDMRSLRIEDLIQRPEIRLSREPLVDIFSGKRILVTGAAGSIGSEVARQIASFDVARLVLLDQHEKGVYDLELEYGARDDVVCYVADISNEKRMFDIVTSEKPELVFHAAAYKHVPLMEKNYLEAIETNILGTYALLRAIERYCKKRGDGEPVRFVNISTDKAVSPENIMGLTKRVVELLVYNFSLRLLSDKRFIKSVSVRFGNVLSSSGSVVPLFWDQIQNGGPVTVTDPEMERFFMTVPEAVNLVLHSIKETTGDDIFALDMGKPVRIVKLAERLILLAGRTPYKDIDIVFTGVRAGEKLKEELFWTKNSVATKNRYIFRSDDELKKIDIEQLLEKITAASHENHSMTWWKTFLSQGL